MLTETHRLLIRKVGIVASGQVSHSNNFVGIEMLGIIVRLSFPIAKPMEHGLNGLLLVAKVVAIVGGMIAVGFENFLQLTTQTAAAFGVQVSGHFRYNAESTDAVLIENKITAHES